MKKLFIAVLSLMLLPVSVNALEGSVNTSYNTDTCTLTVSGKQNGHEATASIFKNNKFVGYKTNTISNGDYTIDFVLTYDSDTVISITVSNENGGNEISKENINIPSCALVHDKLHHNENTLISNEGEFHDGDIFELESYDEEEILALLEAAKNTPEYDSLKAVYDAVKANVGDYKLFTSFIKVIIEDPFQHELESSDFPKGFTLQIALPKEAYAALSGLKFVTFGEDLKFGKELSYTYDQDNELLLIPIDGPGAMVAYLDNEYEFLDGTDNPKLNISKDSDLTIRVNALFNKYVNVMLDEEVVDKDNYEAKEGSTIITFKSSFVKGLSVGNHTLKVNFVDGSASTGLNVTSDVTNPKTGDNIMYFVILLGISVLGIVGSIVYKKLSKKNK